MISSDKDYSSLLGGKLTVFTFCNYGIANNFVIYEAYFIVCDFLEIVGLRVPILLFMTYFGCL
jgi:hypothetical protein